jgi:hypothetical protein
MVCVVLCQIYILNSDGDLDDLIPAFNPHRKHGIDISPEVCTAFSSRVSNALTCLRLDCSLTLSARRSHA